MKAEQQKERELILQEENLKKTEKEEERVRQEKFDEEEKTKEEEIKIKEWEIKFDEEQKNKEEALIEKFYKDQTDEKKKLDLNKSDSELNNNEIKYEKSYTDDDKPNIEENNLNESDDNSK